MASGIRRIFDKAKTLEQEGRQIIHLEIGEPDCPQPAGLKDQTSKAIEENQTRYIPNRGLLELRQQLARYMLAWGGRIYNPETEIVVTMGASEGIACSILSLLGKGDEALIPKPAWPHYEQLVCMSGAKPISVHTRWQDGFELDPDELEKKITPRTKLVVLNFPGNPTGAVLSNGRAKELLAVASKHGLFVISDEVYRNYVYVDNYEAFSCIAKDYERLIVIDSMSKTFAMTGWRIGWVACLPELSDVINRIHQYITVCGVSFAQKAAAEILRKDLSDYLIENKTIFLQRRNKWISALSECANIRMKTPGGSFYLFPEILHKGMDAIAFCEMCLEKLSIALVPGTVFGDDYKKFIRISYGGDYNLQLNALNRLLSILV